ncbi:MAG TPA: SCE4755 family polysaccharide monooxygenase-like protein [Nannocystis sp.]
MLIRRGSCLVLGITLGCLAATTAQAHFVLQSPAALSEQNVLGDPQKAPPCGDDGSAVATGMVTSYKAGDVITITIDETIFHPGHYRVALAMNDISELPEPPPVTPADTDCGSAPIANPPVFPVLADGIFLHDQPFDGPQSFDITIPANVSCDNCTLQVIQFMSKHGLNNPGGCYYHHCANIAVEGGAGSTGGDESGGDNTTSTSTTATTAMTSDDTGTPQTTADESTGNITGATGTGGDPTTGATATGGEPTTSGTGSGGESSSGNTNEGEGGCGCTSSGSHAPATLLGLLGLLGLATRRRSRAR